MPCQGTLQCHYGRVHPTWPASHSNQCKCWRSAVLKAWRIDLWNIMKSMMHVIKFQSCIDVCMQMNNCGSTVNFNHKLFSHVVQTLMGQYFKNCFMQMFLSWKTSNRESGKFRVASGAQLETRLGPGLEIYLGSQNRVVRTP